MKKIFFIKFMHVVCIHFSDSMPKALPLCSGSTKFVSTKYVKYLYVFNCSRVISSHQSTLHYKSVIVSFNLRLYFIIETSQIPISNYLIKITAFLWAILIMCKSIRINARSRVSYLHLF